MEEIDQPIEGSCVAYGQVMALCPVEKPSETLHLKQRENYDGNLPRQYLLARRVNPELISLLVIGW